MPASLNPFAIAALVLLCAALILRLRQHRNAWLDGDAAWPFYAKKPLASPAQVLYHRLVSALPGHIVLAGVELTGVLGVKRGADFTRWNKRICRLQYDFVVCTKDATVLAAIELDDRSRDAKNPSPAGMLKSRAAAAAGIRLLRWPAKDLPEVAAIQELFGELQMPFFEETGSSANQSWWPPISNTQRKPPLS